jgi:hypothetical protein
MRMRLRECERQIASTAAIVFVTTIFIVVLVADGIGVNGCVASASAPEVHVLPGPGQRRRASRGGGVFTCWGQRRRRSDPTVVE